MIDWFKIRAKRNDLLSKTDWTQMPDSPLTEAQRAEWAVYRQTLRDLTDTYSNAQDKSEVVWPSRPVL